MAVILIDNFEYELVFELLCLHRHSFAFEDYSTRIVLFFDKIFS